jgi:hypothetical protein
VFYDLCAQFANCERIGEVRFVGGHVKSVLKEDEQMKAAQRCYKRAVVKVSYRWDRPQGSKEAEDALDDRVWKPIRNWANDCRQQAERAIRKEYLLPSGYRVAEVGRLRAKPGRPVTEGILEAVCEADIIVADFSKPEDVDSDSCTPNVCIEVGAALAFRKRLFIICQGERDIPSNLQGYYVSTWKLGRDGNLAFNPQCDGRAVRAALVHAIIMAFRVRNDLDYSAKEDDDVSR